MTAYNGVPGRKLDVAKAPHGLEDTGLGSLQEKKKIWSMSRHLLGAISLKIYTYLARLVGSSATLRAPRVKREGVT